MAPKGIETGFLVLLAVAIFCGGAMGQSGCNSVIMSMASCLNYVTGSAATPPVSCCSSLANVVQTQPRCLCAIVNGGSSLGVTINQTRALGLPDACNVTTPPASRCNAANGPALSPLGSPETAPAGSPTSAMGPSVTGTKAVPGAAASMMTITSINLSFTVAFTLMIVALYA